MNHVWMHGGTWEHGNRNDAWTHGVPCCATYSLYHANMPIHFVAFRPGVAGRQAHMKPPSTSRASCSNRCTIPVASSRHTVCHATQPRDGVHQSMDWVASAAMAVGCALVVLHPSGALADVEVGPELNAVDRRPNSPGHLPPSGRFERRWCRHPRPRRWHGRFQSRRSTRARCVSLVGVYL